MLFYSVFCGLLLGVLAMKTMRRIHAEPSEKPEVIFADVIKNISRVNNVLQELINNYEQLQKIYKSQETFDTPVEYSSAGEGISYKVNNIRQPARDRPNKKSRFFQNALVEKTTTTTTTQFKHETEMILSEIEADKSREFKIDADVVNQPGPVSKKPIEPIIPNSPTDIPTARHVKKTTTTTTTTKQTNGSVNSVESSSSYEQIPIKQTLSKPTSTKPTRSRRPRRISFKTTKKLKTTIATTSATMNTKMEPKHIEPEIIFVDTHKKTKNRTQRKRKPRIMPEMALEQPTKEIKTRINVKDNLNNADEDTKQSKYIRELKNKSKSSKKNWQSPPTTPKKELDSEEANSKQNQTTVEHVTKKKFEEVKPDPPLKLRTLHKANRTKMNANGKRGVNASLEMSDDDAALTKDLFKTSVLRQAYGDACLKLVVRKCYKACKMTLRSSCRALGCESDVKSEFKRHYKTGCDKHFEDSSSLSFRRILKTEGVHADLTRAGYLSVVCQRHMEAVVTASTTKGNVTPAQTTQPQNKHLELNILRDRYEKACAKISQNKCRGACNYAQNATCVKFECSKRLKKNFKRNCGTQCRIAYTNPGHDSGSDYGSGSDDSYSDGSDDSGDSDDSDDDES